MRKGGRTTHALIVVCHGFGEQEKATSSIHTFRFRPSLLLPVGFLLVLIISGRELDAKEEQKEKIVIADPSRAKEEADFLVQGEYSGVLTGADARTRR